MLKIASKQDINDYNYPVKPSLQPGKYICRKKHDDDLMTNMFV